MPKDKSHQRKTAVSFRCTEKTAAKWKDLARKYPGSSNDLFDVIVKDLLPKQLDSLIKKYE
jgi:hypothetical protein